jgi:hypothetical protein
MALLARRAARPISPDDEPGIAKAVKVLAVLMDAGVGCEWLLWQHKVGGCLTY